MTVWMAVAIGRVQVPLDHGARHMDRTGDHPESTTIGGRSGVDDRRRMRPSPAARRVRTARLGRCERSGHEHRVVNRHALRTAEDGDDGRLRRATRHCSVRSKRSAASSHAVADHHDVTARADVLGGTMNDRRNVTRSRSGLDDHERVPDRQLHARPVTAGRRRCADPASRSAAATTE